MATTEPNLEALRGFVSYPRGGLGHTWAEAVQTHLESLGAEVWRIAVEYARRALDDTRAPVPLLVPLGFWTREVETLEDFIDRQLGELGLYFQALRYQRRAALLLDTMNEIPLGQRKLKMSQIQRLAQGERFASVVVSCREKDFEADFRLPFDTVVLQPLKPRQILEFLRRALSSHSNLYN